MAETYPANYPRPDTNGYSGNSTYGLLRTDQVTANPSQIKTFNSAVHTISMTFSMSNTLFDEWVCWMDDFGQDWFYMDTVTPRTPVTITSTNLFRMVAGTQQVKRGHNYLSITAGFDMVPGAPDDPLAAAHTYANLIDPGTPASPSSDIIDPGTNASPSTDKIISELYGYQ